MPKEIQSLLKKLKSGLKQIYGGQFKKAYLFGSYARGDYDSDSDIDVLIVCRISKNTARNCGAPAS
jgi:predicted nucleotidyltransferase